jgi:hypothetical protein
LHCFFGIFRISKNRESHAKNAALVDADQGFECSPITGEHTVNKEEIVFGPCCSGFMVSSAMPPTV